MVEIDGRPLLDIWLDAFARAGVDEVHVNLHHLADIVRRHLAGASGPPVVSTSFEPTLLGSAGTLLSNREWITGEKMFLACNADNLTDFDLRTLVEAHAGGAAATLTVFRSDQPSAGGVVELDHTGRSSASSRNHGIPVADLVNAGMYAFSPTVLDDIDGRPPLDIGYDLLPRLVGRAGRAGRRLLPGHRNAGRLSTSSNGMVPERAAMIITQTPLRIGLLGGGTDLPGYYREHGGRVLNCAIDKYIYVIVKQRFDDDIYINYSKKEIVSSVADIEHELVREAMLMTGVDHGVEITTLADIPSAGSGLGSSSAGDRRVAARAVRVHRASRSPPSELAREACAIEIERCGKPIGKQDQYIAAFGGIRDLHFGPGEEWPSGPRRDAGPPACAQEQILLFYTGVTRSANTILCEQREHRLDAAAARPAPRSGRFRG